MGQGSGKEHKDGYTSLVENSINDLVPYKLLRTFSADKPKSISVSNTELFVLNETSTYYNNVKVYSASEPTSENYPRKYNIVPFHNALCVSKGILYVTRQEGEVEVMDASDGTLIGRLSSDLDPLSSVCATKDTLYVLGEKGVYTMTLAPLQARLKLLKASRLEHRKFDLAPLEDKLSPLIDFVGETGICVSATHLFLSRLNYIYQFNIDGGFKKESKTIKLLVPPRGMCAHGNRLFFSGDKHVHVLDVSEGRVHVPDVSEGKVIELIHVTNPTQLCIEGNELFVVDGKEVKVFYVGPEDSIPDESIPNQSTGGHRVRNIRNTRNTRKPRKPRNTRNTRKPRSKKNKTRRTYSTSCNS